MLDDMKNDVKKDGLISQIIKRLGVVEKFIRDHGAETHLYVQPPKIAVMWPDQSKQTTGTGYIISKDDLQYYNGYMIDFTPANGDVFTNGFFIRAGTYTLNLLVVTNNASGKLDLYVDNVLVSSGMDLYSAALTYNVILSQAGVVIPSDGYHTFKYVVNGKNAASTNFFTRITKMWFEPSAY